MPDAPTSLTATASGTTAIDLSWTAPSDNGGSAITGYRIEVSPNGTSSWTNRVADTGTTTTTYSHTGLSAGTTRHYRVSAINANGTGTVSNIDNATTGTDPGPLVLTVQAVSATVTEGEPVRYRILMSRPTSGALVESEYSYEGEFVRNGPASVVTGVSSQNGMTYWEIGYETLDDRDGRGGRQFHGQDPEAGRVSLQPGRGVHGGHAEFGDGDDSGQRPRRTADVAESCRFLTSASTRDRARCLRSR